MAEWIEHQTQDQKVCSSILSVGDMYKCRANCAFQTAQQVSQLHKILVHRSTVGLKVAGCISAHLAKKKNATFVFHTALVKVIFHQIS